QVLAYSKWGNPVGFENSDAEAAFIYPIDKGNCVYAVAERVFYFDEGGPVEGGSNEVTPRAVVYHLNNIAPRNLSVQVRGVFNGSEQLFPTQLGTDIDRL